MAAKKSGTEVENQDWFKVKDVARLAGYSHQQVYHWIQTKAVRARDFNKDPKKTAKWRISKRELNRILMCLSQGRPVSD